MLIHMQCQGVSAYTVLITSNVVLMKAMLLQPSLCYNHPWSPLMIEMSWFQIHFRLCLFFQPPCPNFFSFANMQAMIVGAVY